MVVNGRHAKVNVKTKGARPLGKQDKQDADKFFYDCFTIKKELTKQRIHLFVFGFLRMETVEQRLFELL